MEENKTRTIDRKNLYERLNSHKIGTDLALFVGTVADVGKYTSFLYGIAQVVKDDQHIDRVIYSGIAYVFFSYLGRFSNHGIVQEQGNRIISELENITYKSGDHVISELEKKSKN